MIRIRSIFDGRSYSEMRRRMTRRVMQPVFRASDKRLRQTNSPSIAEIHRILICRPNHRLGNLLLLTPLVAEIQTIFPDAEIDIVLAGDRGPELFRSFQNIKHIYSLPRRMIKHPVAVARIALQIRKRHYDLAIDPCEISQSSRLVVALARAKHVIGIPRSAIAVGRDGTDAMRLATAHMAQWPVYLTRCVLAPGSPNIGAFPLLDIRLSENERHCARETLHELFHLRNEPYPKAIIGLFADATGAKRYDRRWWGRFIQEMRAHRPEYSFLEIAPPDARSRLDMGFPCFSSESPRKVAALISGLTCFVSADCGVMHLASASGVTTVGLFSVTDASKYEPYGNGSRAINTNGSTPEEVAQLAIGILETADTARALEPNDGSRTKSKEAIAAH